MKARLTTPTTIRPFTGGWALECAAAAMGGCPSKPHHPSWRLSALSQTNAGYEDSMHPGEGSSV